MTKRPTRMIKCTRSAGVLAAGAAVAALLVGGPAAARPRPLPFAQVESAVEPVSPAQRDQLVPAQREGVSREQATSMAQSRYPGRVVSARTVQMGERSVHEIRILGADNRVNIVRIDAQTGSFL
jgi:hypothetical protein